MAKLDTGESAYKWAGKPNQELLLECTEKKERDRKHKKILEHIKNRFRNFNMHQIEAPGRGNKEDENEKYWNK